MRIFPNGWCDEAAIRPSEHFNERPEGEEISLLVIHNISLPAGQFGTGDVDALFCGTLLPRFRRAACFFALLY